MQKFGFYKEEKVGGRCRHLAACFNVAASLVTRNEASLIVDEGIKLYMSTTSEKKLPDLYMDEKQYLRLELFKIAGKLAVGEVIGGTPLNKVVGKQMDKLEAEVEKKGLKISIPADLL